MGPTLILAIGNAGGNIVKAIGQETKLSELKNVWYVFADCNEDDLRKHEATGVNTVLFESGSDSFPEDIFRDVKKLIIVVGLGGRTGTEFIEPAAIAAKDAGIDDIKVVATTPFVFEGDQRLQSAVSAVHRLSSIDGLNVKVFSNEELTKKHPDLNLFNAFETADKEIGNIISKLIWSN